MQVDTQVRPVGRCVAKSQFQMRQPGRGVSRQPFPRLGGRSAREWTGRGLLERGLFVVSRRR